jgi:hypothetical protein
MIALVYATKEVQKSQVQMEAKETHQLLVCADVKHKCHKVIEILC